MKKGTLIFLIILFVIAIVLWQIELSKSVVHVCTIKYGKICQDDGDCIIDNGFKGTCNLVTLQCEHFTSSTVNKSECLKRDGNYK